MKSDHRRADWQQNHLIITKAYLEYIEKHDKIASLSKLAEITGISIQSIHKHLNELSKMNFQERFKDLKLLSRDLLLSQYKWGKAGKAASAKLFYQIVDQFSEKHDLNINDEALHNMTEKELEEKLKSLKIQNRVKNTKEPINDDDNESQAEND